MKRLFRHCLKYFYETDRHYWGAILFLGGFAGWLWSFPIYGPVLAAAGAQRDLADIGAVSTAFLALHMAGLAAAGYFLAGAGADRRLFSISATLCALLTAAFALAPPRLWPYLGGMLGLAAAPFVVAWGRRLAVDVRPARRGQVVALSFLAGAALNAAQTFAAGRMPAPAALLFSALLLLIPVFAALRLPAAPAALSRPKSSGDANASTVLLSNWWQFVLLVFVFYLTGGLMYQVIQPVVGQNIPYAAYLGTFSYGVAGLIAGPLADRRGRRFLPLTGVGLVGASFTLFSFWPGIPAYILTQMIIQAGYVCLDLFIFLYLADRAGGDPARAARFYGWGFCLNVFSVLAGALAGSFLQNAGLAEHTVKSSLLAGLVLFTAFPFLAGLRESSAAGEGDEPEAPCETVPPRGTTFVPVAGDSLAAAPVRRLIPENEGKTADGAADSGISECLVPDFSCAAAEDPASCSQPCSADAGHIFSPAIPGPARAAEKAESCGEEMEQIQAHLLDKGFTHREMEVVLLVLEGLDNTAIALRMNISKNTLKTHFRSIYKKAGTNGKVSLVLWIRELTKRYILR